MAYKGVERRLSVLWSIDEATSTVHKGELDHIVLEVRQGSQSDDSCPTSGPLGASAKIKKEMPFRVQDHKDGALFFDTTPTSERGRTAHTWTRSNGPLGMV